MKYPVRLHLLAALAMSSLSLPALAAPTFINILTGGTSGVYYPIGVGLSQIYGQQIEGAKVTVQASKASVENLNLLQNGRGELALALSDSVGDASRGVAEAGFKQPLDRLRAIANVYPNYIQIVASQASGITRLEDLKGKRISVGAPKSGTELNARAILKAAGLTYADMAQVQFLPYAESVELIKNRQLDATLQSSGLGMAAIRDLAASVPVRFVPVAAEVVAAIGDPAYQALPIPAGTYDGQNEDVPTVAISNLLVSHTGVSDDIAYQMTRLMYENLPRLGNAHSAVKTIDIKTAARHLPIELHPGAKRYYEEVGAL
ncbi:TAXI family TRAP transporter solute-binding subunit [Pseudomonas sp. dw_358]|uniref:TAXI family TRAP transporter solute-binding subunit n=1 Tax=Pseudomonas sp. dw_358 TaxID=2720083 RepID=UPI001BD2BC36|nr:TAXI family TRAP transporter solute-binding subunit [Pseudomonas sp. dw_358]